MSQVYDQIIINVNNTIHNYLTAELQRVQHCCMRILGLPKDTLEPLAQRRHSIHDQEWGVLYAQEQ